MAVVDLVKMDLLKERHQSAVEAVRNELEKDKVFQLVSTDDIPLPLKTSSAVWRTHIQALGQDWTVDVGLTKRFPDVAPLTCVHEWKNIFLKNPHVLEGGILCTIPGSAAIDSGNPVGLVKYVLNQAKDILGGSIANDFREEFSCYWERCTTSGAQDILIIEPIEKLEKLFPVVFCKGYVCVASSIEKINRWVSNRLDITSDLSKRRLGVSIHLSTPLLPEDYPRTIADLVSLAEINDFPAAKIIINHILTSANNALAILVQEEGEGKALGGIIFKGLYSSTLENGFRPGRVPLDLLRIRATSLIQSTQVSRSKVIRVDHHWIHSRGGDGKDFSNKRVLLIGCGSLGGYVAHLLSRAGIGHLTVTDNDSLGWENLGRHILGASSVGSSKSEALAQKLKLELPHLEIVGIPKDWRDIFESNLDLFKEHDLVVSTVADWRCEGPLNALTRKIQMPPVLLGWLEPYAVAGHCLVISKDGGCFECSSNEFGQFHHNVANFKDKTISREPGGCAHYQHYGPTALMPVASMIASVAIELLLKPSDKSFLSTWVSNVEHFKSVGASLAKTWIQDIDSGGYSRTFRKLWNRSDTCHLCAPAKP